MVRNIYSTAPIYNMEDFLTFYKKYKDNNYISPNNLNKEISYTQVIDSDNRKNINWKIIKTDNDPFCTISVAFYKKNKIYDFAKYEYGLINFFISFLFLNYHNKFKYNIRFYINEYSKNILYYIIDSIISYIHFNKNHKQNLKINSKLECALNKLICYSIKYNINILNIYNNIEIFEYSFNIEYFESEYTSIGMFMRLLPLIDDREFSELYHYCNRVLICDIDTHFRARRQKLLELYIKENVNFGYTSRVGYEFSLHNKCDKNRNEFIYPIINLFIYQYNISYPYQLFLYFYNENMNNLLSTNINLTYLKSCNVSKIFGYGHDEIFTNKYILKYYSQQLSYPIYIKSYIRNGYYSIFIQLLYEVLNNNKNITENISNKIKSIFLIENLPSINKINNYKNSPLEKMYENLKVLSTSNKEIPQIISKILLMNSWKPNLKILPESNINNKILFYPHTNLIDKIDEIIYYLEQNGIKLSNKLLRAIYINKLLIEKYKGNYSEYIRTVKCYKNNNYYFYFLDIRRQNNINLVRYYCDGKKIVKEFPIRFNYQINDRGELINLVEQIKPTNRLLEWSTRKISNRPKKKIILKSKNK